MKNTALFGKSKLYLDGELILLERVQLEIEMKTETLYGQSHIPLAIKKDSAPNVTLCAERSAADISRPTYQERCPSIPEGVFVNDVKGKEANVMKTDKLLDLLQTDYTTAHVCFQNSSQVRVYKVKKSWGVKQGDQLIVDTSRGTVIVGVGKVDENPIIDVEAHFEYKWAIGKVDRTEYDAQQVKDEEFRAAMKNVELLSKQEELLTNFRKALPEGTEGRAAFEIAIQKAKGEQA
jgi:hypothetical protein